MSELALKLIAENKITKDPFLDLGNCGLESYLPSELFDCTWLNELYLGRYTSKGSSNINEKLNSFTGSELVQLEALPNLHSLVISGTKISDISFLEKLKHLKSLDISHNKFSDFSYLKKLIDLHTLNISANNSVNEADYTFLEGLTNLQFLYLRFNRLKDNNFLEKLVNLKVLDLSLNKSTNVRYLEKLTGIEKLYLCSNQITEIHFLKKLINLKRLDLSYNQITDIGSLTILQNLDYLNLTKNSIKDFSSLQTLTNLKELVLDCYEISNFSFLGKLTNLQELYFNESIIEDYSFLNTLGNLQTVDFRDNQISNIHFLKELPYLKSIGLQNNEITDIEPLLPILKKGFEVDFEGAPIWELKNKIGLKDNPITNPPLEITKQGRAKIIEYFEGKRKPLNECKLIFVGDGGVGKTSLMRRIVFNEFKNNEITTHGINKIAWEEIENDKNEKVRINLWDFGGQHIQHSLHQFFFTERVIYVLVLNPRNDLKANYWLDQIEKLGCDSEILIAYNWKQKEDKEADFLSNFYELRKKYPKLKEPFLLSCETGEGLKLFKNELITSVLRNEGLKTEYLVKWFNIKQRLEKEVSVGKNYITYETYQEWCNAEEYHEPERQKSLLKILDSVGSIVFFDKPILE